MRHLRDPHRVVGVEIGCSMRCQSFTVASAIEQSRQAVDGERKKETTSSPLLTSFSSFLPSALSYCYPPCPFFFFFFFFCFMDLNLSSVYFVFLFYLVKPLPPPPQEKYPTLPTATHFYPTRLHSVCVPFSHPPVSPLTPPLPLTDTPPSCNSPSFVHDTSSLPYPRLLSLWPLPSHHSFHSLYYPPLSKPSTSIPLLSPNLSKTLSPHMPPLPSCFTCFYPLTHTHFFSHLKLPFVPPLLPLAPHPPLSSQYFHPSNLATNPLTTPLPTPENISLCREPPPSLSPPTPLFTRYVAPHTSSPLCYLKNRSQRYALDLRGIAHNQIGGRAMRCTLICCRRSRISAARRHS